MNGNVSISTKDDDLKIKYGMYDLGSERELARASFKYIAMDISSIKLNYICLGFHLHECQMNKYYEDFGFLSLAEFAESNFNLDKSALSRCLNVFYRFAERNDGVYKMFLKESYSDFSYSQLAEMVSLKDDELKKINSSMTVKQIREYKNSLKIKVATSQPVDLKEEENEFVEVQKNYSSISDDEFVRDLLESARDFIESNFSTNSILDIRVSGKRLTLEVDNEVYILQFSRTVKKGES